MSEANHPGSNLWWTVRRVANGDARRPWYELTDEDLALLAPKGKGGDGWLPIVLCPTDGVDRLLRLPDGREVVGNFDGSPLGRNRWVTRTVAYHNPARIIGQRGGVDQWSAAYDTYLISDLPEGVYPTHFRPNDTVHGKPAPTPPEEDDGPVLAAPPSTHPIGGEAQLQQARKVVEDLLPYATACVGLPRESWPGDSVILAAERWLESKTPPSG